MRPSSALYSSALAHPWLAFLRSAQLQRIARATGVQLTGTKDILIDRLDRVLLYQHEHPYHDRRRPQHKDARHDYYVKPGALSSWSIVSIDMGIQNLAFAHLHLPRPPFGVSSTNPPIRPELTAWRRLAMSEIADLDMDGNILSNADNSVSSSSPSGKPDREPSPTAPLTAIINVPFSPTLYATYAYALVNNLLSAYRPTHILIERQRFRSGGSSSIHEWTLRVGMFEGILHAVLRTLQHERVGEAAAVRVITVEPARVVRYWAERESEADEGITKKTKKTKKTMTSREVKNAKIDTVGRWLRAGMPDTNLPARAREADSKITLADNQPVHALARAYLRRWKSPQRGKREKKRLHESDSASPASSSSSVDGMVPVEADKLDDLADCLLQGVAWCEWEANRRRFAFEGESVLEEKL